MRAVRISPIALMYQTSSSTAKIVKQWNGGAEWTDYVSFENGDVIFTAFEKFSLTERRKIHNVFKGTALERSRVKGC